MGEERLEYRTFGTEQLPRVQELYRQAGWTAYLGDGEQLERAFRASLYLLGAFDGGRLAGFIRCVGDGEHIVVVQDVLVDGAYRRRGIGRSLLQRVRAAYAHVRTFTLMTDAADEGANAFYQSMKMKSYGDMGLAGYLW